MIETFTESVKYSFTRDELVQIAREQARQHGAKDKAEEEFENIKAGHKTRITRIDADIADCTRKVSSGYEMRSVECLVLKFRPDTAMLVADHVPLYEAEAEKLREVLRNGDLRPLRKLIE